MLKKFKQPVFGKNVTIELGAQIAPDVVIGDHCVIEKGAVLRNGVRLGKNSHVSTGCILGERLRGYYKSPKTYRAPLCWIGEGAILRAGTIIYGDVKIGKAFETGPYVSIREKTIIGNHSRFGNFSDIQGYCKIGNYVAGHSNVTVGQYSEVSDYVWLHPYVILINDRYPPTGLDMKGPHIGRYSVLGAGAVIFPGVRLGEHVIVAAQSSVRNDVKSYQLVNGSPAKEVVDSRKLVADIKGKLVRPYPWMAHRKTGYPWEFTKKYD